MVPSRCTEAYGIGSFVDASVIFPFTVRGSSCADADIAARAVSNVRKIFIIYNY
jgi:hypothetical protein